MSAAFKCSGCSYATNDEDAMSEHILNPSKSCSGQHYTRREATS